MLGPEGCQGGHMAGNPTRIPFFRTRAFSDQINDQLRSKCQTQGPVFRPLRKVKAPSPATSEASEKKGSRHIKSLRLAAKGRARPEIRQPTEGTKSPSGSGCPPLGWPPAPWRPQKGLVPPNPQPWQGVLIARGRVLTNQREKVLVQTTEKNGGRQ